MVKIHHNKSISFHHLYHWILLFFEQFEGFDKYDFFNYKYCYNSGLSICVWTFLCVGVAYEDASTWSSNLSTLCQLLLRLMPTNNQLNEVKPIRLFCILNAWNSPKRLFIALAIFKTESNRFILYLNIKSKRKVGS